MSHINIEIKARTRNAGKIRQYLNDQRADFRGTDRQRDTYFNSQKGRLKLRQGNIENNLIYYERPDREGPKKSIFHLMPVNDPDLLRSILSESAGILVDVWKHREIYYIGNVKFHIDSVDGLGDFVEIEAGNRLAPLSEEELMKQCQFYMEAFGIEPADLLRFSYSDMLLQQSTI